MKKRRAQKEIDMICDDWKNSGLTKAKYCRQNNLNSSSLVKWIKKFGKVRKNNNSCIGINKASPDSDNINFFPLGKPGDVDTISDNNVLEFTLPGGIFFKTCLSEATIKSLLQDLLK